VWVGREAVWPCSLTEDSDLDQVSVAINAFWQEIYNPMGIEMIGVVRSETVDAGPSALPE
jgi:hypothetical protein